MLGITTNRRFAARRLWVASAALCCALVGAGRASAASELADAAMHGDRAHLRTLLESGVEVDASQADGSTALHWAVYGDDVETAKLLIGAKANVSAQNRDGATPLSLASMNGNAAIIALLLGAGASVDERLPGGETPLMMAARTGRVDALEVLIDKGADVNAIESRRGTTALMWAAANENAAAVKVLIEHGAEVGARSATTAPGRRPYLAPSARARIEEAKIENAAREKAAAERREFTGISSSDVQAQITRQIQEQAAAARGASAGAGETAPVASVAAPAEDDDRGGAGRNLEERGGLTPLVFAARQGDIETARILLDAGADVNQATEYGYTPLLTATQNRYYQLGKFLMERGADPTIANKGGWSPLYIATDNRNIEGGDYPTRKPDMDHLEYIELLLAKGADVNARMASSTETRTIFTHQWLYEEGATPFLRAAQSGDLVLLKRLLEHGADPNIATNINVTPLMVASGIGWVEGVTYEWSKEQTLEVVKLLIDLGADVNAHGTEDGRTALMGAGHKGRPDVVQMLVDHGADLAARDLGSRDSINTLLGVTWQAIDYADGLVRVGVQSAIPQPETAVLIRRLMEERGLATPPAGRTLDSICVTAVCR